MRAISPLLNALLMAGLLAGGSLLACSKASPEPDTSRDGDEANADDDDDERSSKDAGKRPRGGDVGDSCSEDWIECDDCDEERCIQPCIDGKLAECMTIGEAAEDAIDMFGEAIDALADAGFELPEGTVQSGDGGVTVTLGDASVTIETAECPEEFACSSQGSDPLAATLSQFVGGLGFCTTGDTGLPPTCTMPNTTEECDMLGFEKATCTAVPLLGSYCVQTCK